MSLASNVSQFTGYRDNYGSENRLFEKKLSEI